MSIVLRLSRASCLERSLITQAWLAANSREHDVLVGVRVSPSFLAHAWVDGFDSISGELNNLPRSYS